MSQAKPLVTFLLLLALTGCIRSLHPLYTPNDIFFEPSLVGEWLNDESSEVWSFSKKGENEYELVYTDDRGKKGEFSVYLLNINGNLFLDFFPVKPDVKKNDFFWLHFVPVHTFAHVKQIGPTLQMRFPNPEWLKRHLKENPNAISHEMTDSEIILTAAPEQLQEFWLKHLMTRDAFGDLCNLKRLTTNNNN